MRKKEYKSVTFGLRYKEYVKILNRKVYQAKGCVGYEDFLEDVKILKKTINNGGRPALLSNIWMKRICQMDKEQLFKFVNNYKKDDLNPFQFEPEYILNKEKEQEDEESL